MKRALWAMCGLGLVACGGGARYAMLPEFQAAEPAPAEALSREAYDHRVDSPFQPVGTSPLSTFSIDVDTASYANVRRFLRNGALPPPDAARIEELINYFDYDYRAPTGPEPFSISAEVSASPSPRSVSSA